MVPKVSGMVKNVKTPDYMIFEDGNLCKWDLKELKSNKPEGIRNQIHKKAEQADNFVIDISKNELDLDNIYTQAEKIFIYDNTRFVKKLMIVKNGKIIRVLERRK